MKKFLVISFSLLALALLAAMAVFCYLSFNLQKSQTVTPAATSEVATMGSESTPVPEGVPLRDLPLSEGQKSALDTVGVDVETFVITPAMQACAAEKLGAARLQEIIGGAAPSFTETVALTPCLSAE